MKTTKNTTTPATTKAATTESTTTTNKEAATMKTTTTTTPATNKAPTVKNTDWSKADKAFINAFKSEYEKNRQNSLELARIEREIAAILEAAKVDNPVKLTDEEDIKKYTDLEQSKKNYKITLKTIECDKGARELIYAGYLKSVGVDVYDKKGYSFTAGQNSFKRGLDRLFSQAGLECGTETAKKILRKLGVKTVSGSKIAGLNAYTTVNSEQAVVKLVKSVMYDAFIKAYIPKDEQIETVDEQTVDKQTAETVDKQTEQTVEF